MSDLLTDVDLKTERALEPPKRWLNWWRIQVTVLGECVKCAQEDWRFAGQEYSDCACDGGYPSVDVAETEAAQVLSEYPFVEWLGAYPEGERPE